MEPRDFAVRDERGEASTAKDISEAPLLSSGLAVGIVKSLRPKQWSKNAFVFAGLIFGMKLGDGSAVATVLVVFAVFCALSSSAYLLNDVMDVSRDRIHPKKSRRPIAAGVVPSSLAVFLSVALSVVGLGGAFAISPNAGIVSTAYFVLTFAYTFVLKHILLVDLLGLSAGYVLRALAGAIAINVAVSEWLLLCTILLALFLGITKRRHEVVLLADSAGAHRKILSQYSVALLDQMVSLVSSAVLLSYALYTILGEHDRHEALLGATFPFVVYGLFRYLYLVYNKGLGGSPEELLLKDVPLLGCAALWAAASVAVLYWP